MTKTRTKFTLCTLTNCSVKHYQVTGVRGVCAPNAEHTFSDTGSLNERCEVCGLEFSFGHRNWTGWLGVPCYGRPVSAGERYYIEEAWREHNHVFADWYLYVDGNATRPQQHDDAVWNTLTENRIISEARASHG